MGLNDSVTLTIQQIQELSGGSLRTLQRRSTLENWPYIEKKGQGRSGKIKRYFLIGLPEEIKLACSKITIASELSLSTVSTLPAATDKKTTGSLTEKQVVVAAAKIDLTREYLKSIKSAGHSKKAQARDGFILAYNAGLILPEIRKILGQRNWKTLETWKRQLRAGAKMTELADRRGQARKGESAVTAQQSRVLLQYALNPNRLKVSEVIRQSKKTMPVIGIEDHNSEATYRRWLMNFKEHNYHIWCFQRGGEKRWNDECCLSIERDPELLNIGDVLVADGHSLNFEILNPWTGKPQRMTLLLFYDMRSNHPCGWEIGPTENTSIISTALRRAILTLGKIPRVVYIDNGRAFGAKFFMGQDLEQSGIYGVYDRLGIQTVFAWPYHGQSKTVERFFGSFSEIERLCPTYIGTSIDKKPPRLQRGERLHRKVYEGVMAGKFLTIEMAHQAVAAWFDDYSRRPQERSKYLKGDAPIDLFEPGRGPGVDPISLTALMWSEKKAQIRAGQIKFMGRTYCHDELYGRRHDVEVRYDLQDQGYIAVYEEGQLICIASEQDKVHPMALLGSEQDREKLSNFCEIKNRQKKEASCLARKLLENEILPAHKRRLEMDGVTPIGPPPEPVEMPSKKLTISEEKRIGRAVKKLRNMNQEECLNRSNINDLPEVDRYEVLIRQEVNGEAIQGDHARFMRYFETTTRYLSLEKTGYWDGVRKAEIKKNRGNNRQMKEVVNG